MKTIKKIVVLLLTAVMAFGMSTAALAAVSITVKQDSSYQGTNDSTGGRTFTYKQIFRSTRTGAYTATGGNYDEDGTPGEVSGDDTVGFSYYLNSTDTAQVGKLGTWDATNKSWTKASGNQWFKLTLSADGSRYIVAWDNENKDTDTVQAAARWLEEVGYPALASGSLTWDAGNKQWSASPLEEGYYLIKSGSGNNLVAATSDIEINEKNAYPPIDKTQEDEDVATQSDADRPVAVGDVLKYEVKVSIPATAAAGETIKVYDKASPGLTYNNDVSVKSNEGNATVADGTAEAGEAWRKVITVTEGSQGKDVIFAFTMTVNEHAVVEDPDKENEAGLNYNNEYDSIPDKVYYKIYYTGIYKIDGKTEETMADVEFILKEDGKELTVIKSGDYYVPSTDAGATSTVITDKDGVIVIRGLDGDKTYTLTESKTQDGYNLLDGDVTLQLEEDKGIATPGNVFVTVSNFTGVVLPATGGAGTAIFYILGSILVVGAGVLLVTKKRMDS